MLLPLLVQAKKFSNPKLGCKFFFTELLTITDSYVLGFWADPEEDSSGDEDNESSPHFPFVC